MSRKPSHPSLRDLLLASDFGRAHPHRVAELLRSAGCANDDVADTPTRHSDDLPLPERVA